MALSAVMPRPCSQALAKAASSSWAWKTASAFRLILANQFQEEGDRAALQQRVATIKAQMRSLLEWGSTGKRQRHLRALAKNLLKLWPALWTFADVPDVEPTNYAAERGLRAAVIYTRRSRPVANESVMPLTRPASRSRLLLALHDVDDRVAHVGVEAGGGEERSADVAGEERVAAPSILGRDPLRLG
jgi:hypothetical protein